jgi:Flp pilus assembly protein TadD
VPTVQEALQAAEQALAAAELAQADFIYQRILEAVPDEPHALNGRGVVAYRQGRIDDAGDFFRRAIAGFEGNPSFHNNLHLVYYRQKRDSEAIAEVRRAIELAPQWPQLHNNLGNALKQAGQLEAAAAALRQACTMQPDYADAFYNLGNTLVELDRLEEAEAAYRRSLELTPGDMETQTNLGSLLKLCGRLDESLALCDAVLAKRDDIAEVHRNRATLRLQMGDFRQGWPEYEWRLRTADAERFNVTTPRWQGELLADSTILLIGEQGMGDVLQMVRYASLVKQRGATVWLQYSESLFSLLAETPGIDRLISPSDPARKSADFHLGLFSLPAIFETTVDTIPHQVPYVFADRQRVERWRDVLNRGASPGKGGERKIGIAWQGNPQFSGDRHRSAPLREFAPLAVVSGVRLISLQKNHGREQLSNPAPPFPLEDLGMQLDVEGKAFVDTAAVMMNLDLVVTTDTAIAHLAGALGVPVWVALQHSPNWRWLTDRDDSPWYPTMRLFRQHKRGDWPSVFERIAAEAATMKDQGRGTVG